MLLARIRIQPAEAQRFYVDYAGRLPEDYTIYWAYVLDIEPTTTPEFEVSVALDLNYRQVLMSAGGGVSGTNYKVTLAVYTDETDETWEDEIEFLCEDT